MFTVFRDLIRYNLEFAIGLILGLMVAWLLEYFDDTIRFADDVDARAKPGHDESR